MRITHSRTPVVLLTASLAAMLMCVGCSKKNGSKAAAAPPPATVIVESIGQKTVPIYSEFVGQTKADDTVELRARVEGVLQKIYFRQQR